MNLKEWQKLSELEQEIYLIMRKIILKGGVL